MSVELNSIEIKPGFKGVVDLGEVSRLFVRGEAVSDYFLYGTLFRSELKSTVSPPSESSALEPGTVEPFLLLSVSERSKKASELKRLKKVREDALAGRYDYGVNDVLIDTVEFLSTNTIKPLPSMVVGGKLGYSNLLKNNSELKPFDEEWHGWSHVGDGLSRYTEDDFGSVVSVDSPELVGGIASVPLRVELVPGDPLTRT